MQAPDNFTKVWAMAFDEREVVAVSTGFQAFFGSPVTGGLTIFSNNQLQVDIDIIRANEMIAATVTRGSDSSRDKNTKNTSGEQFTSFGRVFPLIEEESTITSDQILVRGVGETPYQALTRVDRMRRLAKRNIDAHHRRIIRTFEVLAAQSILTGKQETIIGTTNNSLIYDFKRNAGNTISVGLNWDQPLSDPIGDIDTLCIQIRKTARIDPDMAVFSDDGMDLFLKNDLVKEKADNRRFNLVQIDDDSKAPANMKRFMDSGFKLRGKLRTPKGYTLWLFTYSDRFDDANGVSQKYMPDGKVLIASSMARADRYFGPADALPNSEARLQIASQLFGIENADALPMPPVKNGALLDFRMFHHDVYWHANNKGVVNRTQAAPIFAPTHTDAFGVLEDFI